MHETAIIIVYKQTKSQISTSPGVSELLARVSGWISIHSGSRTGVKVANQSANIKMRLSLTVEGWAM